MTYRQLALPPALARWFECLWALQGPLPAEGRTILPDGRMEIVLHFGDVPCAGERRERQAPAIVSGQIQSALWLGGSGEIDAVGIRVRPAAGGAFTDWEAIAGLWARAAREQAGNAAERHRVIVEALGVLTKNVPLPDPVAEWTVRAIESQHGRGAMDGFVPGGIGMRQWERRFVAATGLGPKAFARIARLQRVAALYESGDWPRWADLALECGFYDQAHMAADFRAFTGQPPDRFFREGRPVAEFYRDGFFQDRWRRGA